VSRLLDRRYPHAYRVVKEVNGYVMVFGPYATLSAAKGKRTSEVNYHLAYNNSPANIFIERTPAGDWEQVEL
jgi:hypothetical protein